MNKWTSISCPFMTEESDDSSDPNVIVTHKLPWRSESMSYRPKSYHNTGCAACKSPECLHPITGSEIHHIILHHQEEKWQCCQEDKMRK